LINFLVLSKGNDDYGTMSAWYCFGSLGFYPVTGEDWYFVGSPVFDDVCFLFLFFWLF